jgi:hypothetical protein
MNNDRRKQLAALAADIETAKDLLEGVRDEEQDAYDNLPESLQDGERGEVMQQAIEALDQALDDLGSVVEAIEEAGA